MGPTAASAEGLLAGLARALDFQGERERGRSSAKARSRWPQPGGHTGLAKVLVRSYSARGTTPLEEILPMLTEARICWELGDAEIYTEAMAWPVPTSSPSATSSRPARDRRQLEIAERTAQPFMNHVAEQYGSAIALCDGDLTAAEERAARSRDWACC